MASGCSFNESEAYAKLLFRLMICGPKVVRRLLSDHVNKNNFKSMQSFLDKNKKILKNQQYDHFSKDLFPVHKPVIEWDISLVFYVIMNTCPQLFKQKNSNLDALRSFRNSLCHPIDPVVKKNDFKDKWEKMDDIDNDAFATIADPKFEKEIRSDVSNIYNGDLTLNIGHYQKKLYEWCRREIEMLERIDILERGKVFLIKTPTVLKFIFVSILFIDLYLML